MWDITDTSVLVSIRTEISMSFVSTFSFGLSSLAKICQNIFVLLFLKPISYCIGAAFPMKYGSNNNWANSFYCIVLSRKSSIKALKQFYRTFKNNLIFNTYTSFLFLQSSHTPQYLLTPPPTHSSDRGNFRQHYGVVL